MKCALPLSVLRPTRSNLCAELVESYSVGDSGKKMSTILRNLQSYEQGNVTGERHPT